LRPTWIVLGRASRRTENRVPSLNTDKAESTSSMEKIRQMT